MMTSRSFMTHHYDSSLITMTYNDVSVIHDSVCGTFQVPYYYWGHNCIHSSMFSNCTYITIAPSKQGWHGHTRNCSVRHTVQRTIFLSVYAWTTPPDFKLESFVHCDFSNRNKLMASYRIVIVLRRCITVSVQYACVLCVLVIPLCKLACYSIASLNVKLQPQPEHHTSTSSSTTPSKPHNLYTATSTTTTTTTTTPHSQPHSQPLLKAPRRDVAPPHSLLGE